jgi:hypothetical protein
MKEIVDKEQKGQKKPYDSPKFLSFGGVTNLTQQNVTSNASDSGNNMMANASA